MPLHLLGKTTPRIGVVVTTHDRPEQLPGVLGNILRQTCGDVSVVVSDNGNNPDTVRVVREIQAGDSRVAYVNNHGLGKGPSFNRNFGMASLSPDTPYTFVIDDDDRLEAPNTLESLAKALDQNQDAPMAYGIQLISRRGVATAIYGELLSPEPVVDRTPMFPAKAMMFRTRALQEIGGFDSRYQDTAEDFGLAVDTLNWAQRTALKVVFSADAAVAFEATPKPNKTTTKNRLKRLDAHARSRRIVRRKFLKHFGYES